MSREVPFTPSLVDDRWTGSITMKIKPTQERIRLAKEINEMPEEQRTDQFIRHAKEAVVSCNELKFGEVEMKDFEELTAYEVGFDLLLHIGKAVIKGVPLVPISTEALDSKQEPPTTEDQAAT